MQLRWIIRNGEKVLQKLEEEWEDIQIEQQEKECKFGVGQTWKTRDGKNVTIAQIGERPDYPILATYKGCSLTYTKEGNYWGYHHPHTYDLAQLVEEKPEKKEPLKVEGYVNLYPSPFKDRTALLFPTKADADTHAHSSRIACIKVTGVESN